MAACCLGAVERGQVRIFASALCTNPPPQGEKAKTAPHPKMVIREAKARAGKPYGGSNCLAAESENPQSDFNVTMNSGSDKAATHDLCPVLRSSRARNQTICEFEKNSLGLVRCVFEEIVIGLQNAHEIGKIIGRFQVSERAWVLVA